MQAYELSIQFEPFYFLKKEDNLRNTIVYHTFVSYFNFWYLVQYVIYLFIHVQNICWSLTIYQVYTIGLDLFYLI